MPFPSGTADAPVRSERAAEPPALHATHLPMRPIILALAVLLALTRADAVPAASALQAVARNGQIFLTWREADTPAGTTFNAYVSAQPIRAITTAARIGHHIEPRSAID